MALIHKVRRTMFEHKPQYIGSILLLIVSCMVFIMFNFVSANIDKTITAFSENNLLSDAEFYTVGEIDAETIEGKFGAIVEESGLADCEVAEGQKLRVFSENDRVNLPAIVEGRAPNKDEIALDRVFAETNGYTIGKSISVDGKVFTVSGYVILPNYIYIIESKDQMINDPKTFGIAVVDKEDFNVLSGAGEFYAIRFNDRNGIKSQETAVRAYLRTEGLHVDKWQSTAKKTNVSYVIMEVGVTKTMSVAMPLLMLTLCIILICMIMSKMIKAESVIIGTLFAQGYRRKELIGHYLLYPLIVGGVGVALGTLLGYMMCGPMFNFMLTAFPMPVTTIEYVPQYALIAIALPMFALCLSVYLVMKKVLKSTPGELMKGSHEKAKINFIEKSLKLDHFGFIGKFQLREQVRSLSRSFLLVFGIIVATMLILYGLTMQSSMDSMLNEGISSVYHMKNEYVFKDVHYGAPPAEVKEQFNAMYVTLQNDEDISFYATGVLPDSTVINLKDSKGEKMRIDKNIITMTFAKKMGVTVGDTIKVYANDTGIEYTFQIDAIADCYAGELLFLPLDRLNAMLGEKPDAYIGMWCDHPVDFPKADIASTKSLDMLVEGMNNMIALTAPMVYGLTFAAFIVGLIIIYIVTGLVVEENRINISLMKVFGYRKKEIRRLILNSNTVLVILGYLLGIPILMITVGAFFMSLAESLQMILPVKLNIVYMIFGFLVVMLTFEFAKVLSRKKIDRIQMSEALKSINE